MHGPDVGFPTRAEARPPKAALAGTRGKPTSRPTNSEPGILPSPAALAAARAQSAADGKFDAAAYIAIRDAQTLADWVAEATEAGVVAIGTEGSSPDPMLAEIVGISLATAAGRAAYVPLGHRSGVSDLLGGGLTEGQIPRRDALALLKPLLQNPAVLKVGHNIKYDVVVMSQLGEELSGASISLAPFDDMMLISYVLDGGTEGHHDTGHLAEKWLGHKVATHREVVGGSKASFDMVEIDRATRYAAEDADVTLRLWRVLKPRLVMKGLVSVYERLERPLVPVLARMERRGVTVDRQILSRLSGELAQGAARLEDEIYAIAGEKFTIGSPKQLGDILFGKLGLAGGGKTKTGQWSTSAQILEELAAEGHELPRKIVDWRQMTKLKSTYTDALPGYIHRDTKRVHTSYALGATTTGRLSSVEPNLQNIPIRTAEGRKIRTAFIADQGNKLISADYSQIELRILAHVADIPQLKAAFANDDDIHAITASEMFNVPVRGHAA